MYVLLARYCLSLILNNYFRTKLSCMYTSLLLHVKITYVGPAHQLGVSCRWTERDKLNRTSRAISGTHLSCKIPFLHKHCMVSRRDVIIKKLTISSCVHEDMCCRRVLQCHSQSQRANGQWEHFRLSGFWWR